MNRSRLASVLIALLAVLALAVGAAVIDAPTATPGAGGGSGGGSGGFFGSGSGFSLGGSPSPETVGEFPAEFFQLLLVVVGVTALVLLVLLWKEFDLGDLRRVAVGAVVLGTLLAASYFVLQLFGSDGRQRGNGSGMGAGQPSFPGGGSGGAADTALQPVSTELPLVAVAVGAVLIVGLAAVLRSEDEGETDESDSTATDASGMAGVGRAAGRAADRIEHDTTLENGVYRAWREMTDHLDVARPESSTPGEFARAATEAGMRGRDVDELTDLFTRVRYGDERVTDERERRATSALRRIEETYAEEP
ncbi:DUF4129 domain-containing protein [Halococcus salsus]|uniref:DUF4129 domain-containing protein n=1 Tax=Halococcus salsus TaxID=2162894 RepID=UPI001F03AA36|nr:DUF4129 domain-containing protein [Halococcus salsus]